MLTSIGFGIRSTYISDYIDDHQAAGLLAGLRDTRPTMEDDPYIERVCDLFYFIYQSGTGTRGQDMKTVFRMSYAERDEVIQDLIEEVEADGLSEEWDSSTTRLILPR